MLTAYFLKHLYFEHRLIFEHVILREKKRILYKVKNSVIENTSCGNFNIEETLTAAQSVSKSMEWKIKCLIFSLKGHEFYVTSYSCTNFFF